MSEHQFDQIFIDYIEYFEPESEFALLFNEAVGKKTSIT